MKTIGILFGQERSFPYALVDRINGRGNPDVVAEPVRVGGIGLETPKKYDLILDRISPQHRAALGAALPAIEALASAQRDVTLTH